MNAALLELLVCPLTRTPLVWDEQAQELISEAAGLAYPVRDGIPVLLVDEARPIHSSPAFAGEGDHPQGGGGAF